MSPSEMCFSKQCTSQQINQCPPKQLNQSTSPTLLTPTNPPGPYHSNQVVAELETQNMLNDTFIWFSSDNGGVLNGGAVNYLLRGTKGTAWDGAVHVPSFVHYPRAATPTSVNREFKGIMHVSDIYPTVRSNDAATALVFLYFKKYVFY